MVIENGTQRRLYPSTSMLVAFDCAARTGSFTAAAEELNLTTSAISRQVRALEEQLGVVLFRRINKAVALTEAGRTYAREIHLALKRIQAASLCVMTNPRSGILNLAILPTFGTRWLMPRLPGFIESNPGVTVNFVTKLTPFDCAAEGIHAAIHFGLADWPDAEAVYLMGEESIPVAAPAFLERYPVTQPADLSTVPRLLLASRPDAWAQWLDTDARSPAQYQGLLFEQFSTAAQAAAAGLGVALLPKFLIASEIERGELRILFERPVPTKSAYYLMIPEESADYAPVLAFREWLLAEVGRS
nr:LysR family transcriptional regulator [Cucumibacter marinus]